MERVGRKDEFNRLVMLEGFGLETGAAGDLRLAAGSK